MTKEVLTWVNNGSPIGVITYHKFKELKDCKHKVHKEKVRKWVKYPTKDGIGIVAWGRFGYLDLISSSKDFVVRVKNSKHKLLYLLYLSDHKAVSVNKEKCTMQLTAMDSALMSLCVGVSEAEPLSIIVRAELNNWLDMKAPWNKNKMLVDKYICYLMPSINNEEHIRLNRDLVRLPRKQALLKVLGESGKAASAIFKYVICNRNFTDYALNVQGLKVEHLYSLLSNKNNKWWQQEYIYKIGCLLPQRYHHVIGVHSDTDIIAMNLLELLGKNKFKHINYTSMKDVHDYWAILSNALTDKKFKLAQDPELVKLNGQEVEGYTIVVPKYNTDLIEWGNKLSICVGSYSKSINDGNCLIVGLYKDGEISLCVDIKNNGANKAYTTQIRGKNNVDAEDKVRFAICEKLGVNGRFEDVTYTSKTRTKYKFAKVNSTKESFTQEAVYEFCERAIYEFKKLRRDRG